MRNPSFAVIESALQLLTVADPWTKQLLGEPGLAEEETENYRRKLEAALVAWIALNADLSVSDELATSAALTDLYSDLDALARQEFPKAFRMGFGTGSGVAQAIALAAALNLNSGFLISSLIPYLSTDLTAPESAGLTLGQIAENRGPAWSSRIGLYGGSYWTAIWLGVQESLRETLDTETVPVRRLLDPGAQHCATCPPKAREYGSWSDMLASTGGLPADGSDDCHSNCRCQLQLFLDSEWVPVG